MRLTDNQISDLKVKKESSSYIEWRLYRDTLTDLKKELKEKCETVTRLRSEFNTAVKERREIKKLLLELI